MTKTQQPDHRNTGHGHVVPRPDGMRTRCGGPAFCKVCQQERAALEAKPSQQPELPALHYILEQIRAALNPPGRFKPTPGEWVADAHEGWVHPMTEVRTEESREEGGHSIVRVRADFNGTVGKAEYEWANAAFVAACSPQNVRAVLAHIEHLEAAVQAGRERRENPLQLIERWKGDDKIESPFNACMHKGYCLGLKEGRESRKVVAWRYMPSPTWGEYVITQDPKVTEVARSMGVEVEELTVGATSKEATR